MAFVELIFGEEFGDCGVEDGFLEGGGFEEFSGREAGALGVLAVEIGDFFE